jgi:hypothetical protein
MNTWKPIIFNNEDLNIKINVIENLILGEYSCIIIKNVLNNKNCTNILNNLKNKNILNENLEYNNIKNFNFRKNSLLTDIGLTIDNQKWIHTDMNLYWNETNKFNEYLDSIFDKNLNPVEIFINMLKNICDKYFELHFMKYNNYVGPKAIIRIHSPFNEITFPYHTDGFNYGVFTNRGISDNIRNQIPVANRKFKTNSVCAALLIIQQSKNKDNIELYNCLVDDLKEYKNEIQGRSHRVGTKYGNILLLEKILKDKPHYKPILDNGDMYIFSSSRIHKLTKIIGNKRIVIATFFTVDEEEKKIIIHQ